MGHNIVMRAMRPDRWWKAQGAPVRYALAALAVVGLVLGLALATTPVWLTPILQRLLPKACATAGQELGVPVQVRSVSALAGWRPGLEVRQVMVGANAVSAQSVRVRLSWLALLRGRIRPARMTLVGPQASLAQTSSGVHVVGLPASKKAWAWRSFLQQEKSIRVRDGLLGIRLLNGTYPVLRDLYASWNLGLRTSSARVRARVPGICDRCTVSVQVPHAVLRGGGRWRGAVGINAKDLRLGKLRALSVLVPSPLNGHFSGQLWTIWRGSDLRFASGEGRLERALLPGGAAIRTLDIPAASARFSYKQTARGFRFYAGDAVLAVNGRTWRTANFYLGRAGSAWSLSANTLDLTEVRYALTRIRGLPRGIVRILAMKPRGKVVHFRLHFTTGARPQYRVRTRFYGVGVHDRRGGVRFGNLAGALYAHNGTGRLMVLDWYGRVVGPQALRGPFHIRHATAAVTWVRAANGYSVSVPHFQLATTAGDVGGAASVVTVGRASPVVLVRAHVRKVRIRPLVRRFFSGLPAATRQWLRRTLRGGTVESGQVVLKGALDEFPFRHGQGLFTADLRVHDGRYRFLPSWPAATGIAATVQAHGAALSVTGAARLGALTASKVSVRVQHIGTPAAAARVVVHSHGTLPAFLRVLGPHLGRSAPYLPRAAHAAGMSRMVLHLHIPAGRAPAVRFTGNFFLDSDSFAYPWRHGTLRLTDLTGILGFDQRGPRSGKIKGDVLGGPVHVALTDKAGVVTTVASGEAPAGGLAQALGPLSHYINGAVPWRVHAVSRRDGRFVMAGEADLKAAAVRAPYPAGKPSGVPLMAYVRAVGTRTARWVTVVLPHHLGVHVVQPLGGAARCWVGIGRARPPAHTAPGVNVSVQSGYLNTGSWAHFISKLSSLVANPQKESAGGLPIRTVALHVGSFAVGGRIFRDVRAELLHTRARWSGSVSGPDAQGQGFFLGGPTPFMELLFSYLRIPPVSVPITQADPPWDPRTFPRIDFKADHLRIGRRRFGRAVLIGEPFRYGFLFDEIRLEQPLAVLSGHGRWTLHGGHQETTFAAHLKTTDLGGTLTAWGYPRQVASGRADLYAALNWPGDPLEFALKELEAKLTFVARNGRFLKVNEGAGKLLGIFNIDSITRYLTLDFSSLFGRGFAFGQINGKVYVENGRAITPAIDVEGPAANVSIKGRANLIDQTFNLTVQVNPHMQNNLTLATGLLGGPIAGAAVLLMQKLFAREISEGTRMTYFVEGPWSKPLIKRRADLP